MMRAPAAWAMEAVASVLPLSTTMHSAIRGQGISATTWPMDSASFSAGMMMEMGGGIRLRVRLLRCSFEDALAKADVDVDLGVLGIGGSLVVDLEVGLKCACSP